MKSNYFKSFFITIILTLTLFSPAFGSNFDALIDMPSNHWATGVVLQVMDEYHLLESFPDHTFRGEKGFTRYEFVAVFSNFLNLLEKTGNVSLKTDSPFKHQFTDVENSHWAYKMVYSITNDYGIMENFNGIAEEKFLGAETVTRYEVASALYNILSMAENKGIIIKIQPDISIMDDLTDLSSQQANFPAVKSIVDDYGIMIGFPDGTFRGDMSLNRYQFAAIMAKTMEVLRPLIVAATSPKPLPTPVIIPTPSPTLLITPTPASQEDEPVFFREKTPFHFDFLTGASTGTNKMVFIENLNLQFYPKPLTIINSSYFSHSATDILGTNPKLTDEKFSLYLDERLCLGYPFKIFKDLTLTPYIGGRVLAVYRDTEKLKSLEGSYGLYWGGLLNLVSADVWHIYTRYSQTNLIRKETWTSEASSSNAVNIHVLNSGSLGFDYYVNKNNSINAELEVSESGLPEGTEWQYYTILYGLRIGISF